MAGRNESNKSEYKGVEIRGQKIRITFHIKTKRHRITIDQRPTELNQKKAFKKLQQIKDEIKLGIFEWQTHFPEYNYEKINLTFLDFSKTYLKNTKGLAKSTREGYLKILNRYWLPYLGHVEINKITKSLILTTINKNNITPKTWNNVMTPIRSIFKDAWYDELIDKNPTERIPSKKHQKLQPDPLSLKEVWLVLNFLKKSNPEWLNYFQFAFFSGLRTSELIALNWGDIDFLNGTFRVDKAKVRKQTKGTKTNTIRDVKLNKYSLQALKNQKQKTFLKGEIIFLDHMGNEINDDKPPRLVWNQALKSVGLRHRPAYQTRHTSATMHIMAGEKIAWSARQHGHSIRMFTTTYAKWIDKSEEESEGNLLEKMIKLSSNH